MYQKGKIGMILEEMIKEVSGIKYFLVKFLRLSQFSIQLGSFVDAYFSPVSKTSFFNLETFS